MLIPLQQYVCDDCQGLIRTAEEGWLEWLKDEDGEHGFRIVHHALYSPRQERGETCYYPSHLFSKGLHLNHYCGSDGLVKLLSLIERPNVNIPEVLDTIRRLHIPFYEEARQYWSDASNDDYFAEMNEYAPYLQEHVIAIIKKYGGRN